MLSIPPQTGGKDRTNEASPAGSKRTRDLKGGRAKSRKVTQSEKWRDKDSEGKEKRKIG